ncbi:hypothetical protein L2E82_28263 [Cichorium intybus]|uniref:Uncharacterized protein n=1 Tax=Cichorium intybus TaxID=13427 RepID=A0ACB9CVB9_CICIN|nr:hypothetical protein L2E82_28263 [Cichorium intybus]
MSKVSLLQTDHDLVRLLLLPFPLLYFQGDMSFISSKTADEKGNPPVQKGSQILGDVDLYTPDTLDPTLGIDIIF